MTSDVDLTQAHDLDRTIASDPDPYIAAVLNLWPPESDSDPGRPILWRGALAIAIAGVATLVLLSVVIFESGHRALAAIWISVGLPVVLLAAAAARFSAGHVHRARDPHA
jgi:hypothetical protein